MKHPLLMSTSLLSLTILASVYAESATVTVSCPSRSISSAISAASRSIPLTINLSGSCVDNVLIGPGYNIFINARPGTTLRPRTANQPVLRTKSRVSIANLAISSSLAAEALIEVSDAGFLNLDKSSVRSNTVNFAVVVYGNSYLELSNTNIVGGLETALDIGNSGASISAYSNGSSLVSAPNSTGGEAIGCYQSRLSINPSNGSTVTIGPSPKGLSARGCSANVGAGSGKILFTGTTYTAVQAKLGDSIKLRNVEISNNLGYAVEVSAGSIEIDASIIKDNAAGLFAKRNSTIYFNAIQGPSTVTGPNPFNCYQGGHIYAETNTLTDAAPTECLEVDGDVFN
jgi:hypothetical protein